jgi:hypothetical protein
MRSRGGGSNITGASLEKIVARDELDESEWPVESDMDSTDESVDTKACPFCAKAMYDIGDRCPHCGNFVAVEANGGGNGRWIVWTAIVVLAAIAVPMMIGLGRWMAGR